MPTGFSISSESVPSALPFAVIFSGLKADFPVWHVPSTISMDQAAAGVEGSGVVVASGSVDGVGSSVTEVGSFPVKREFPPPASITAKIMTTMIRMM